MRIRDLRKRRAVCAVLFTFLLSMAGWTNAMAQTFTVGNLNYSINSDGATVTVTGHVDGTSATGELVIPENVEYYGTSYPVTMIGNDAFYYCTMLSGSLVIPNSVTEIGLRAFSNCYGFNGSLTIPASVSMIGQFAFRSCGFTTLNYNPISCGWSCWYSGNVGWFENCYELDTLNLGDSVESIPSDFFNGFSSFTGDLIIPESVTRIYQDAFKDCSGITVLSLPNSLISIGNSAFYNCSGLSGSLIIADNVTSIGEQAFANCTGFSGTLTIGNSVTQIGNSAFFGACEGFTSFDVKPETPPTLGTNVFTSANYDMPVLVPCGSLDAYSNASGWDVFTNIQEPNPCLWDITATANLAEGGTITGAGIFEQGSTCTLTATANSGYSFVRWIENGTEVSTDAEYSFTVMSNRNIMACFRGPNDIVFADPKVEAICLSHWDNDSDGFLSYDEAAAVTDLGQAFQNHSEITSFDELQHFTGLTYINDYEFWNCYNLASVTIPIGVTYIGEGAFGYTGLTSLTYNAINCSVNSYWLYSCSSIAHLTIGDNVQIIPNNFVPSQSNLVGELVIPASVTYVGSSAFSNCSGLIGTLVIPNSVTNIGDDAFANTGITGTLTIGTAITTIGSNAFQNCTGLTGIIFNATNCTSMGYYYNREYDFYYYYGNGEYYTDDPYCYYISAFSGCSNITMLQIGESVQTIPDGAFRDLTGITGTFNIPNSVVTIGDYAFAETNLSGVLTIPENVTSVGLKAFAHTGITAINFNAENCTKLGYLHWLNSGYNELEYISAFYGCTEIASLQIGNNVHQIPTGAFKDLQGLSGAYSLPNTLETIGSYAFDNIGITGVLTIPESVISIGSYAFSKNDITTVNFNATNCTEVGTGWYWSNGVDIAVSTFYSCNNLTTLNIGSGVQTIPNYAFVNCAGLTGNLSLPNSLISIGESAFERCSGFSGNLVIPYAVETIGNNAFKDCTGLGGTLTIGESATTIHGTAFTNTNFSTMNYNATNCVIGGLSWDQWHDYQSFVNNSFSGMPLLTTLNIGNNVESISQMAFKDLTTLTGTLTLPNSLTTIGDQAFYNCYGLEGIVMGNSVEAIGSEAFRNCGGLRGELTLPESLQSVGIYAFASCDELNTINYNAINCTEMGNAQSPVFYDCASLEHINIGENVESIPNYAFKRCSTVVDMTVAAVAPPTIEASTFGTVSRAIPVNVPFGSGDDYRSAQYWEEFFNIVEGIGQNPYTCHWNANANQFAHNMTAIGIIQIDGVEQTTDALEIGAFCGNECRGSQMLAYYSQVNRYLVFLTLYGEPGDLLTFKLYDHELGEESVLGCTSIVTFEPDGILGTYNNPYVFNFTTVQNTALNEGWSWYSSYVELGNNSLQTMEESLGENGVMIKSQSNGFVTNDLGGWMGSLHAVNNESMYLINTNAPCVLSMTGNFAVPSQHTIPLLSGWTWIGYPSAKTVDVNEALVNLNATDGDIIKARNCFAVYAEGNGWFGTLYTLSPSMGFMYHSLSTQSQSFVYGEGSRGVELRENLTAEHNHFVPNVAAYPYNMNVLAVVNLDGEELSSENYELAAFANGECRGSAKLMYVAPMNRYVAFLTVVGNDATTLSFGLYDAANGTVCFDTDDVMTYSNNAIVGSIDEPYVINFRETTGANEFANRINVYPNPVARGEMLNIGMTAEDLGKARVEIVNTLGMTVSSVYAPSVQTIAVPQTAGVYLLRVTMEGKGTYSQKIVVR